MTGSKIAGAVAGVVLIALSTGGCQSLIGQLDALAQGRARSPGEAAYRSVARFSQPDDIEAAVNALDDAELEQAYRYMMNSINKDWYVRDHQTANQILSRRYGAIASGGSEPRTEESNDKDRTPETIRGELIGITGANMAARLRSAVYDLPEDEIEQVFAYIQEIFGGGPYSALADQYVVERHERIKAKRILGSDEQLESENSRGRQIYETVASDDWVHAHRRMASLPDADKTALFEYLLETDINELPFSPPSGGIYGEAEVFYRGIEYSDVLPHYVAVMDEFRYEYEEIDYVKSLSQEERDRLIQFASVLKTFLDPEPYIRSIVTEAEQELNEERAQEEREARAAEEAEAESRQREIDLAAQPRFRDADWEDSEQTILVRESRRGVEFGPPAPFDYGGGYEGLSYTSTESVPLGRERARVMYNFLRGRLYEGRQIVDLRDTSVDDAIERFDTVKQQLLADFGPADAEDEFHVYWQDRFVDRILVFHWLPNRRSIELRYAWRTLYSAISQFHRAATGETY